MTTETQIRNLKKRIEQLELIAFLKGVPLLVIYLPDLVLNKFKDKEVTLQKLVNDEVVIKKQIIRKLSVHPLFEWLLTDGVKREKLPEFKEKLKKLNIKVK
jgi:hypothetical protein